MKRLDEHLNELSNQDARAVLLRCCGSSRWVDRMLGSRPFADEAQVLRSAGEHWRALSREDWLEAFAHHPRIGDRAHTTIQHRTADLSSSEQAGMAGAGEDVRAALLEGNVAYEERFGHVFLICATGKSANEMLEALNARLKNTPETELHNAMVEQEKITELRLKGLVQS